MRVLTVRQPWVTAILTHGKMIENRQWSTGYRGPVALHASRTVDRSGVALLRSWGIAVPDDLPRGVILGTVELVDVRDITDALYSRWVNREYRFHWVLSNPRGLITPVPWSGTLGLRELPEDITHTIRRGQR